MRPVPVESASPVARRVDDEEKNGFYLSIYRAACVGCNPNNHKNPNNRKDTVVRG